MNSLPWSDTETARLRALRQSCGSAREISAIMPGRTYNAISTRLSMLGLSYTPTSNWRDDQISTLKRMWNDEGASASSIAKATGMTRNAVIGKARRIGLASRPSPIIRRNNVVELNVGGCEWMHGEPKEHNYCGEKRVPGKPYCDLHCRACYLPLPPRNKRPLITTADKLFGRVIG